MRSPSLAGLFIVPVAVVVAVLPAAAAADPPPARVDFADDETEGPLEQVTAPPPDVKHPSLLGDKYRGVPGGAPDGAIADPLATHATRRPERPLWLGARVGAGMFDDDTASARAGVALGLAGRYRTSDASFVSVRADWSRRGGDAMAGTIHVLGASAGLGLTVAGGPAHPGSDIALALIAQLRTDLRLADLRGSAPVHRAGLGIALGAEVALPATPFTAGVRVEQGLTELVAGARDRAILAELGIDLR